MSLTLEQEASASDIHHHSLMLATAGSGKTKTIIEKTNRILKADYSFQVVLITFTNAAVNEIRDRLEVSLSQSNFRRTKVMTFDTAFLKQAKTQMNGKLIIGPMFYNLMSRLKIYIQSEGLILEEIKIDADHKRTKVTVSDITNIINNQPTLHFYTKDEKKTVLDCYKDIKEKNALYDLKDVAQVAVDGIASGEIQPLSCSHLLIDEFQDTDPIQYEWLKLHGLKGIKLTPVGDDDQSIYSWRGARSYETMLNFKEDFNPNIHMLSKCFRCKEEIVNAAKNMIEFNKDRIPKDIVSGIGGGGSVTTYIHKFESSQYHTFAENYKKHGGEWAIITRTNTLLNEAEDYLKELEIPYSRNNNESIFDTPAGDFIIKLCSLILEPKNTFLLGEVLGYLHENENLIPIICRAIIDGDNVADFINDNEYINSVFYQLVKGEFMLQTYSDSDMFQNIEQLSDLIIESKSLFNQQVKCEIELTLLQGLKEKAGPWFSRLQVYADKLKEVKEKPELDKSVVSLLTCHGSKGLEFENVAIFNVMQDILPYKMSDLDEERRLMFVATTRAKARLYIHSFLDNIKREDKDDCGEFALYNSEKEYAPANEKEGYYPSEFISEIYYKDE